MSERTSAEILRAARARIEDPKRWTREEAARNAEGKPVPFESRQAVCWCALGAIGAECAKRGENSTVSTQLRVRLSDASASLGLGRMVTIANDKFGHAAVLRIYDRAIALAEQSAPSLAMRDGGANG